MHLPRSLPCVISALVLMGFAIPALAQDAVKTGDLLQEQSLDAAPAQQQVPANDTAPEASGVPAADVNAPPIAPDTASPLSGSDEQPAATVTESAADKEQAGAAPEARKKKVQSPRASGPNDKVFDAKSFMLENGMQVIVIENNRVPVVTQMVWYRTGAADEPRGKSGIAHFMEHLMFKGSEGLAPGEFSKIVRNLGGQDNAFTSQDYTAYFQTIASEHLEKIMTMEAGRMRSMNPPAKEVDSERQVILEERSQRTDNDPNAQFAESLNAALYTNHPYGIPVIGWAHEMEGLSWDDAKDFYDHWYAPNNAILVISGDVDPDKVHDLARTIYGKLEKVEIPERKRTTSPPLVGDKKLSYAHPTIRQPVYQRIYRAPSFRQNKSEALALQVLEDIVGSGPTSRLYKSLVIDQKLATGAGLSYNPTNWDDGSINLYAIPAPGVSMEQIEEALDAEIAKLVSGGITDQELSESITRMQAEAVYARDSLTGPAMTIGYALVTGSSLDDIEYWPRDIGKVKADAVKAVAAQYLDTRSQDARYVTGHLLPQTDSAPKTEAPQPAAPESPTPATATPETGTEESAAPAQTPASTETSGEDTQP